MTQQTTPPQQTDRRVWLGVALLILGSGLFLRQLNILPYQIEYYFFNIWTFFLALGTIFIVAARKLAPGLIFLALGTFGLLRRMDIFIWDFNLFTLFWPLVIIIAGVALIMRRSNPAIQSGRKDGDPASVEDYIDEVAFLGGRERTINSQNFQGGKIFAMFGGSEIDMRGAALAPGTHILDIFVMFGGTEIIVPPDWTVRVEVFSLLGGFSDKRYSTLKVIPDSDKVLVIKGFVMFGGGEVTLAK